MRLITKILININKGFQSFPTVPEETTIIPYTLIFMIESFGVKGG